MQYHKRRRNNIYITYAFTSSIKTYRYHETTARIYTPWRNHPSYHWKWINADIHQ